MCDKSKDAPPPHQRLKGGQPQSARAYVKMCSCMCVCVFCVCDNLFFVFYPGYYIVLVLIYSRLDYLGYSVLA